MIQSGKKNIEIQTLPNGLTIAFVDYPQLNSLSINVIVKTGSVFENKSNNGINHFVEHVLFTGNNKIKEEELIDQSELLGLSYNGHTHKETTSFDFYFPRINYQKVFPLVKEIIFNPGFNPKKIEQERKIILQEFPGVKESIFLQFSRFLYQNRFKNKNNPYIPEPIGKKNLVSKIKRPALLNWHQKFYTPTNSLFCLLGKITPKIKSDFIKLFERLPKGVDYSWPKFNTSDFSSYIEIEKKKKNLDKALLEINFPTKGDLEIRYQDRLIIFLIARLLGGTRSSIFFKKLRLKEGVYNFNVSWSYFSHWGIFHINLAVSPEILPNCKKVILEEIKSLHKFGFKQNSISQIKNFLNANSLLSLDHPENVADDVMNQLISQEKILLPEEVVDLRNQIKKEKIDAYFKQILDLKKANIISFVPAKSKV